MISPVQVYEIWEQERNPVQKSKRAVVKQPVCSARLIGAEY